MNVRAGTVWLLALAFLIGSCASTLEQCLEQGGRWYEGPATAPRDSQSGACIMPSDDGGKVCRDGSECSLNLCYCTGELAGPWVERRTEKNRDLERLDGTEGTGVCATFPPGSGTGFHCLVHNGRIMIRGIIVD